jgi:hypothetical protein
VGERARREGAERRDKVMQAQIAKEAQVQQELKQERDKALDEVAALKATVEKLTRAGADAAAREAEAERRDNVMQAQIAKEAEAYQDLKRERDKALDEAVALRATVEKLTRAGEDAEAREAEAERRDRALQAHIAKVARAYQDLKQERDKAFDEVAELEATVENLTRARSEEAVLEAQVRQGLKQGRDKPLAASQASNAAPAFAFGPLRLRDRRGFWVIIGVQGVAVVLCTAIALGNRSVSVLMIAAIFLALAVLLLFFAGRQFYPDVMDSPARRQILFHAIGSTAILLWIALTQAVAGRVPPPIGLGVVLLAAIGALWTQRLWFAWYVLVPLIGVVYMLIAQGYSADWPTSYLNVFGGIVLVLLSAAAIVSVARSPEIKGG